MLQTRNLAQLLFVRSSQIHVMPTRGGFVVFWGKNVYALSRNFERLELELTNGMIPQEGRKPAGSISRQDSDLCFSAADPLMFSQDCNIIEIRRLGEDVDWTRGYKRFYEKIYIQTRQ